MPALKLDASMASQQGLNKSTFHSSLFKEPHAPKNGWRVLEKLPQWCKDLKWMVICKEKYGEYKYQNDFAENMDFSTLGVCESAKNEIYNGQWRNGLKWGKGENWTKDGIYYIGSFEKGLREGHGRMVFRDGSMYQGQWKADKRCGKGCFYHWGGSRYEGDWKDDTSHGRGKEYMMNGDVFEGEYKIGQKEGKGKLVSPDGS